VTLDSPISRIVVVGGGITGWSVAAALRRRIPSIAVEIIAEPPPADSIADRVPSTLPSIIDFHADVGLTDADTVIRAQSGLRAGTLFEGWASGSPSYVHAYGNYGRPIDGTPFHQQWLRAAGPEPFDHFSPAACLASTSRVAGPRSGADSLAPQIGYGLHLTLGRYRQLMRAYALHLGTIERSAQVANVRLGTESGSIDGLLLDDGGSADADLFVDCTGPAARIRSAVGGEFIDWGGWLRCDRLAFGTAAPDAATQLLDRVAAHECGWTWNASSPAASVHGAVYSSAQAAFDEAVMWLPQDCHAGTIEISIKQGRWAQPWCRNCVAIGDAAVSVEPLEWTNLHLVHSHIDRLVSMMPGCDCVEVELAEYNRQCNAEADRIRDFICLHYVTSRRDEPFWKDAKSIQPPDSLAHTLSLFAERGRLPYYEEETFSRDSWLAVLLGQGVRPRRTDPLADIVPTDKAAEALAAYRNSLGSFVAAQPLYHDAMSNLGHSA
jgi:tryptophan halogenase